MLIHPQLVAAMKKTALSLLAIAMMAPAFAQNAPPSSNALPPPGMNDPGVDATAVPPAPKLAPKSTPAEAASASNPMTRQIPALPSMHDDRDTTMPSVSVRQEGDNSIQEYRQSGRVYMVIVTPKGGVPQTYMVDDRGRLTDANGAPPVRPVMYKVLEWGKSKPADASADQDDNSGH